MGGERIFEGSAARFSSLLREGRAITATPESGARAGRASGTRHSPGCFGKAALLKTAGNRRTVRRCVPGGRNKSRSGPETKARGWPEAVPGKSLCRAVVFCRQKRPCDLFTFTKASAAP
ncbi:MAG: hypothetical protein K6U04_13175 [Armatimonadetes bacterium]|nr:hypothetical protein [Armatimonadota bacterium]